MGTARALLVAGLLCSLPLQAEADAAKAWAAAKANLPSDTAVLVGLNVTHLAKSKLVTMAFPLLLSKKPEVKDGLAKLDSVCGIDPWKSIDAVVVGSDKDMKQGVVFVAFNGVDHTRIVTCIEDLARDDGVKDAKVITTQTGAITELVVGTKKLYLTWIGKDVVALPLAFDDRAQLEKWTGKRALAKAKVGKYTGKVNTRAAVWAVSTVEQAIDTTKMKSGYGSLGLVNGAITADLHFVVDSALAATETADKSTKNLVDAANGNASLRPLLAKVSVTSVKDEVVIKAAITELELMSLAGGVMGGP